MNTGQHLPQCYYSARAPARADGPRSRRAQQVTALDQGPGGPGRPLRGPVHGGGVWLVHDPSVLAWVAIYEAIR